jgi:hypothetical protein
VCKCVHVCARVSVCACVGRHVCLRMRALAPCSHCMCACAMVGVGASRWDGTEPLLELRYSNYAALTTLLSYFCSSHRRPFRELRRVPAFRHNRHVRVREHAERARAHDVHLPRPRAAGGEPTRSGAGRDVPAGSPHQAARGLPARDRALESAKRSEGA